MAIKRAEYMSVESAENFILQHEDSSKRLYNRYLKTVKERKRVFERHRELQAEGYKRLSKAIEYTKNGLSAESLSYLAYTLASEQTSYSDFLRVRKQTLETLNSQFSIYRVNKKGELVLQKKFLKNYKELQEFGGFMELMRDRHISQMYNSTQLISMYQNAIASSGKRVTWSDMKTDEMIKFFQDQILPEGMGL